MSNTTDTTTKVTTDKRITSSKRLAVGFYEVTVADGTVYEVVYGPLGGSAGGALVWLVSEAGGTPDDFYNTKRDALAALASTQKEII